MTTAYQRRAPGTRCSTRYGQLKQSCGENKTVRAKCVANDYTGALCVAMATVVRTVCTWLQPTFTIFSHNYAKREPAHVKPTFWHRGLTIFVTTATEVSSWSQSVYLPQRRVTYPSRSNCFYLIILKFLSFALLFDGVECLRHLELTCSVARSEIFVPVSVVIPCSFTFCTLYS